MTAKRDLNQKETSGFYRCDDEVAVRNVQRTEHFYKLIEVFATECFATWLNNRCEHLLPKPFRFFV